MVYTFDLIVLRIFKCHGGNEMNTKLDLMLGLFTSTIEICGLDL